MLKQYLVVIGAADARHAEGAKACITGLAERSKITGHKTHYIHVCHFHNLGCLTLASKC